MIEGMLSTCKNEIIRELGTRNISFSSSTPKLAKTNNDFSMQEDPLAELEADNHNDMDIELEGKIYFQGDHD
jgi:flagellar assembly factor FliW